MVLGRTYSAGTPICPPRHCRSGSQNFGVSISGKTRINVAFLKTKVTFYPEFWRNSWIPGINHRNPGRQGVQSGVLARNRGLRPLKYGIFVKIPGNSRILAKKCHFWGSGPLGTRNPGSAGGLAGGPPRSRKNSGWDPFFWGYGFPVGLLGFNPPIRGGVSTHP